MLFKTLFRVCLTVCFSLLGLDRAGAQGSSGTQAGAGAVVTIGVPPTIYRPPASLTMTSEAGDPIGGGGSFHFDEQTSHFYLSRDAEGVQISCYDNQFNSSWSLSFGGPVHGPLHAGFYSGAVRTTDRGPTALGLEVASPGHRPRTVAGSFEVKKILYSANGISSFWATFEQYADGATAPLRGEIKYLADAQLPSVNQAPAVYAGAAQRATFPAAVALAGAVQDDGLPSGTLTASWDQVSGPGFVTFGDSAQLQTTATFPTPGQYLLRLTVSDGARSGFSLVNIAVVDPNVETSLTMTLDAEEPGGAALQSHFDGGTGRFQITNSQGVAAISYFEDTRSYASWSLYFAAPAGAPLAAGTYAGAMHYPEQDRTAPGLTVTGPNYVANRSTGSFTIKKIIYGLDHSIVSLWATFENHLDGAPRALVGEIKIDARSTALSANQAPGVNAGPDVRLFQTRTLPLVGVAGDDGLPSPALATTWSVLSGPGAVVFADATQRQTTATFATPGVYVLQLAADDGELSATSTLTATVVDAHENTSLTVVSEPGEYIGGGETHRYTLEDGSFNVALSDRYGIAVSFAAPDLSVTWNLTFLPPGSAALAVGNYVNAARARFEGPDQPGLDVSGLGHGAGSLTGSFRVVELSYSPSGTVLSFHATFVQHTDYGASALRGEIFYHAQIGPALNLPPAVSAGADTAATLGQTLALTGTVSDDGRSAGGRVTTAWSKVSGPGVVTFGDPSALATSVTFTAGGKYVLQLQASDGDLSSTSQLTVEVTDPQWVTALSITIDNPEAYDYQTTYAYTLADGTIALFQNYAEGVSVDYQGRSGGDYWSLYFSAAAGRPLTAGTYLAAQPFVTREGEAPGVEVTGIGNSDFAGGRFSVYEVSYSPEGAVTGFHATFRLVADDGRPILHGEVRYRSLKAAQGNEPPAVSVAARAVVTLPAALALSGTVTDDGRPGNHLATRWSQLRGPGTASFSKPSALQTMATFSKGGAYVLQLRASDGEFEATTQITVLAIEPKALTSLTLRSEPGDFIGAGEFSYYTPAEGAFAIRQNDLHGVSVSVVNLEGEPDLFWYLDFAAPGEAALAVGTYRGVMGYPAPAGSHPQLQIAGQGRGSNVVTGQFTVKQIEYGPGESIVSFWATFEQHSEGAAPALRGEIKYHATGQPTPTPARYQGSLGTLDGVPSGLVTLDFNAAGLFTGRLVIRGIVLPFSGALSGDGTWLGVLSGNTVSLTRQLDGSLDLEFGESGLDYAFAHLEMIRSLGSEKFSPTLAGRYAVSFLAIDQETGEDAGAAWALVVLDALGRTRAVGKFPNGVPFTYAGQALADGSVYVNIPGPGGRLGIAGRIRFTPTADFDVTGSLTWARYFPVRTGQSVTLEPTILGLEAQGFRIVPLTPEQEPLTGAAGPIRAMASFSGPSQPAEGLYFTLRGRTALPAASGSAITLQSTALGLFRGSFRGAAGQVIPFDGVFLPKVQEGLARYSVGGRFGYFRIQTDDFP